MSTNDNEKAINIKIICPSINELSVIVNQAICKKCNIIFNSESQLWMHDIKVHQKKNLHKNHKQNVRYHCPIETCIYALKGSKYFKLYKYLKQHYLKVHAEKTYKCSQCTKSFSTNAAKEAHARICGREFKCECLKVYNNYDALSMHAKRNSHRFDIKYKPKRLPSTKKKKVSTSTGERAILSNQSIIITQSVNIPIVPKPTCEVAVQTEESHIKKKSISPKAKKSKNQVCRQTQTTETTKEKQNKKSAETQTTKAVPRLIRVSQVGKCKKDSTSKLDENLVQTLASEYLQPYSPFSLRNDIIFEDFWEEKSTSGTQTSPEKNGFLYAENCTVQNEAYKGISRSDPMLNEETYANKFSSIETQTEKAYCQSLFETDPLAINNETQTTDNFTEAMEPLHIYNNTCTQTCDEILSSDLVLSNIQTQTAWSHLDESTVSTETQTKAFKCVAGCSDSSSWFTIQTNHMETQTDLFNLFDALE